MIRKEQTIVELKARVKYKSIQFYGQLEDRNLSAIQVIQTAEELIKRQEQLIEALERENVD